MNQVSPVGIILMIKKNVEIIVHFETDDYYCLDICTPYEIWYGMQAMLNLDYIEDYSYFYFLPLVSLYLYNIEFIIEYWLSKQTTYSYKTKQDKTIQYDENGLF